MNNDEFNPDGFFESRKEWHCPHCGSSEIEHLDAILISDCEYRSDYICCDCASQIWQHYAIYKKSSNESHCPQCGSDKFDCTSQGVNLDTEYVLEFICCDCDAHIVQSYDIQYQFSQAKDFQLSPLEYLNTFSIEGIDIDNEKRHMLL